MLNAHHRNSMPRDCFTFCCLASSPGRQDRVDDQQKLRALRNAEQDRWPMEDPFCKRCYLVLYRARLLDFEQSTFVRPPASLAVDRYSQH